MATKYELYVNASSPTQIFNVKRVYGVVGGDSHSDGEDRLAELMSEYQSKNGNGYLLLNVYRCVDEYYYFEYSDASGSDYGVARVHFKDLSNRQLKKSGKYSGMIEKMLLLSESDMLPERFSRKAYSTVLKGVNLFTHAVSVIATGDQPWHSYCAKNGANMRKLPKSGSYYFFPQQYYAQGSYGCDFNANQPHNETILGFNMRNLATNAKILLETKKDVRSAIVYKLFSFFPIYLTLLALIIGILRFSGQR